MKNTITIDGSMGEGGGQIVRSSLALAVVTARSVRIENIRAGRPKPGLLRQHLTAVRAAAGVGQADVEGDELGSRTLEFRPAGLVAGDHEYSIGSAGSTTLVLQTVLPALLRATAPSRVAIEGGTHNLAAPPFDFIAKTFLPVLERMGARVRATLERPGFYPAGGGRIVVEIEPAKRLRRLVLGERGEIRRRLARARVHALPATIAKRELERVRRDLGWREDELEVEELTSGPGPGNVLTLEIESDELTEVFTGFGRRGASSEAVAGEAIAAAKKYLASGAAVGEHLADQLLLPMALAGGGEYLTTSPTRHTLTNIEVIRTFLDVGVDVEKAGDRLWRIAVA